MEDPLLFGLPYFLTSILKLYQNYARTYGVGKIRNLVGPSFYCTNPSIRPFSDRLYEMGFFTLTKNRY